MCDNCNSSEIPITETNVSIDCELWDNAIDSYDSNKEQLYENIKSKSAEMLWRLAESELVLSYASIKKNDEKSDKEYVLKALQHSEMGLELDQNSFDCMKWFCASAGRATYLVSSNDRIKLGLKIQEQCDKAFAIHSNDPMLHFIFGRWAYEVSGLTFAERNYSKIFGTLESSYSKAMHSFIESDKLRPNWKINYLWIAKVLIAQNDLSGAFAKIEKALEFPVLSEEDYVAYKELNNLRNKKEFKKFIKKDETTL